jgi:protein translocation Sec62 family protein
MSLLALRVSKIDPTKGHEGHNHAKPKRVKGLWTVRIEQHQEAEDDMHYVWLYEGSQWKTKLYAVGALILIMAVVLFPLWPLFLRQGVWYLSMGMLGLLGLFFAMAIFRLILFIITMFAVPPGLWLYPNLFEDVGFFDSFKPLWAWQEVRNWIRLVFPILILSDCRGQKECKNCPQAEARRSQGPKGSSSRWQASSKVQKKRCCSSPSSTSACDCRTSAYWFRACCGCQCSHTAKPERDGRGGRG